MSGAPVRPQPPRDAYNAPFWDGLRERVIRMPRCTACGHVQYPMGPACSECLAGDLEWVELSGRGSVWGYCVYHHAFHPAFADELPYNVAMVELDEGPVIASNVVEADGGLRTGLRVEAVFDDVDADTTLLKFRPTTVESP